MSWSFESGYSHKCSECGGTYYDSDGGCDCQVEAETKADEAEEDCDDLDRMIRMVTIKAPLGFGSM